MRPLAEDGLMDFFHGISPRPSGRPSRPGRSPHAGFTLVELLVTLAIAGVLLAVGVPAMTSFLADQAAAANADEFAEALRFARAEAIKRGGAVTMCASTDLATCSDNWKSGWIVKADDSGKVLRVQNPLRSMGDLTAAAETVTFQSTGIVTEGAGAYVFAAADSDANRTRTVRLNSLGRVAVPPKGGS
jgi:type IV fimbrial biogenesis protein FimT